MDDPQPSASNITRFACCGLSIRFPHKPYETQRKVMMNVTRALRDRSNCIIESPTGTGKTLAIMSAVLAWNEHSSQIGQPFVFERIDENLLSGGLNQGLVGGTRVEVDSNNNIVGESCSKNNEHEINPPANEPMTQSIAGKSQPARPDRATVDVGKIGHQTENHASDWPSSSSMSVSDNFGEHNTAPGNKLRDAASQKSLAPASSWPSSQSSLQSSTKPHKRLRLGVDVSDENDKGISQILSQPEVTDSDNPPAVTTPRIYFVTRTHDQIKQAIGEINRTPYTTGLVTTVLGGKNRLCINESVNQLKVGQSERCLRLVNNTINYRRRQFKDNLGGCGEICPFYFDHKTVFRKFSALDSRYADRIPDIEDIRRFGDQVQCCPYYGVRSILQRAEVTFCTYNYIIDSSIRGTLSIDLRNSVVIFDEAHNIEGVCRESASFSVTQDEANGLAKTLGRIVVDIEGVFKTINEYCTIEGDSHNCSRCQLINSFKFTKKLCEKLKLFIDSEKTLPTIESTANKKFSEYPQERVFTHSEFVSFLEAVNIDSGQFDTSRSFIQEVLDLCGMSREGSCKSGEPELNVSEYDKWKQFVQERACTSLSSQQIGIMRQLMTCLVLMHQNDGQFLNDFRLVLERTIESKYDTSARAESNNSLHAVGVVSGRRVSRLSILCMRSAVAFDSISNVTWSVILASGTLAPIGGLIAELGCEFKYVYEGLHVISNDRLFAAVLNAGPTNTILEGSYKNSKNVEYLRELGSVILDVCGRVKSGILCFISSYDRMEHFISTWKNNGIIDRIESSGRRVFIENKKSSTDEFRQILTGFRLAATAETGSILFAVFRGKISEGINFSDHMARAVISVGIPYPYLGDLKTKAKMSYNNSIVSSGGGLPNGWNWYTSQASRPLNQALGRCIRHKNDWGAIILIESRLMRQGAEAILSNWVKKTITSPSYDDFLFSLERFIDIRENEIN